MDSQKFLMVEKELIEPKELKPFECECCGGDAYDEYRGLWKCEMCKNESNLEEAI